MFLVCLFKETKLDLSIDDIDLNYHHNCEVYGHLDAKQNNLGHSDSFLHLFLLHLDTHTLLHQKGIAIDEQEV